jgi:hypothetical protein
VPTDGDAGVTRTAARGDCWRSSTSRAARILGFARTVGLGRALVLLLVMVLFAGGLLGMGGCGPRQPSAEEQKQQCFATQKTLKQAMDLFYADTGGQYPPFEKVVLQLNAKCPSGGTYSFDSANDQVSCSVHGHTQ